jgi:undecaprenyl-diphosphatase
VRRPVVPWPRAAAATIAVCVVVVLTGAVALFHTSRSNSVDNWIGTWVIRHLSHATLLDLLKITTPRWILWIVLALIVALVLLRRFRLAALAALGPGLAVVMTEWVIKPIVHRTYLAPIVVNGRELYLYPSGHEAGVASLTAVLVLVLAAFTSSRAALVVALVVAATVDFLAAVALVGNGFHFGTDTIAGVGVSVASVLGCGLLLDRLAARRG